MGLYESRFDNNSSRIFFVPCDSSDKWQQWVIWETGNASDSMHICLRTHVCLTDIDPLPYGYQNYFSYEVGPQIKDNKEARSLKLDYYNQSDPSQLWLMNSTTHQLSNAQYPKPKVCITTRHIWHIPAYPLLLECNGYGYESPNPHLSKHQSFYRMPALDENGEQLCIDSGEWIISPAAGDRRVINGGG